MFFDEKELIGKVIAKIRVDGFGINIITQDGWTLDYNASDGGYSCWDISKENCVECDDWSGWR